jgi:hypothetical protein
MISIIAKIDKSDKPRARIKLHEIYAWLSINVVDYWQVSTLVDGMVKVDLWGLEQEQDAVAFKLRFSV